MNAQTSATRRALVVRQYWQSWRQFVIACVSVAAVFLLLCVGWPLYMDRDTRGASMQSERGVVTGLVPGIVTRGNADPLATVTVHLGSGISVSYDTHAPVSLGEALRVQYRRGRSGRVYVEGAEPAGAVRQ